MSSVQVVWLLNSQVHLTPSVYGRPTGLDGYLEIVMTSSTV